MISKAFAKWAFPLSTCRAISSAVFAGPLPALRADFEDFLVFDDSLVFGDFLVFEAGDVRRFAGAFALMDFFELLL